MAKQNSKPKESVEISKGEEETIKKIINGELDGSYLCFMKSILESIRKKIDDNEKIQKNSSESNLESKNAAEYNLKLQFFEGKLLQVISYWENYKRHNLMQNPDDALGDDNQMTRTYKRRKPGKRAFIMD